MSASDGGDDLVGIGDPMEGIWLGVMIVEEAVDGGLEIGDGSEHAAFEAALGWRTDLFPWKPPRTEQERKISRQDGMIC
jgi:hypothetical protein